MTHAWDISIDVNISRANDRPDRMPPLMQPRPLFVKRILDSQVQRHVQEGRGAPPQALELVRQWHESLVRDRFKGYSETQLESAFIQTIFVGVLGYELPGAGDTHSVVPKRTGARGIPDFVLGTFTPSSRTDRWRAVGELKGVGVDLDVPQVSRYVRETPVQQAFRYALNGQPGVEWIIVSNFDEIRLYRNGYSASFQRWTIAELCAPERLDEFHVLVCRRHLAPREGEAAESLKILGTSDNVGIALTQGFYDLYDQARQRLLSRFVEHAGPAADIPYLYGKAHKLLNRVLFAAFCEDHPAQLLPPSTLAKIHLTASESRSTGSYWSAFKRFFADLDRGSPPGSREAFNAFNGGLFAPDEFLDSIALPDELFTSVIRGSSSKTKTHVKEMAGIFGFHVYDFGSELDVDSLGAIFEQSLKDLPHHAASVRGHGTLDVTRREKHGVYYTPPALTTFLASRSLDAVLEPIRQRIAAEVEAQAITGRRERVTKRRTLTVEESRDLRFLNGMLDALRGVTAIDPACGSGAFLVALFTQLYAEYDAVNFGLGSLKGAQPLFGLDRIILRNNLHGVDILSESTEIAKLSIWLRTASPREPLEKLDATLWSQDALRPMAKAEFDLVLSNPPWGAELQGWSDAELLGRFPDCGEEKDSYAVFILRAAELLRAGGVLAYVLPNSWLTVKGYEALRRFVLRTFDVLELVNVWKIFEDVNHDCCLLIARKKSDAHGTTPTTKVRSIARGLSTSSKWQALAEERWEISFETDSSEWLQEPAARFETMYNPALVSALAIAQGNTRPLGSLFDVTVGIQVYHNSRVSQTVIKSRAFHSKVPKGKDWYPSITGNAVQRYYDAVDVPEYVLYSERLCDKRELEHYRQPRILVQQIFWKRLRACLQVPKEPYLYLNTLFSVSSPKAELSLEAALAFLNSHFVSAAYERWANRLFGDKFPKVSKLDLARLPVPMFSVADNRVLHDGGTGLSQAWARLTGEVRAFREFAASRGIGRTMSDAFWALSRREFVAALQGAKLDSNDFAVMIKSWELATDAIHGAWKDVASLEESIDRVVADAFGIDGDLRSELLLRAPSMTIEDALLP